MSKDIPTDKIKVTLDAVEGVRGETSCAEHHESGVSALHGRIGDNVTLLSRGIYSNKPWSSIFPGAYYEVIRTIGKLFSIFTGR